MNDEHEQPFDADVADLARQLENADFSHESQLKEALRAKLLQQAKPRRRFSPVYALGGLAAALLLVLIVAISVPPAPPTAAATPEPIFTATMFVANEATSEVVPAVRPNNQPTEVFIPAALPEGYVLYSTFFPKAESPLRMVTAYYQRDRWQEAVQAGDPYTDTVDYLYISQQSSWAVPEADAGTAIPARTITPPPEEVFATSSTFYDPYELNGQLIFTAVGEGTGKSGRKVHFATRRDDKWLLQAWSFQLDGDTLLRVLNDKVAHLQRGQGLDLEMDAPGSCGVYPLLDPEVTGNTRFQAPLDAGSYSVDDGFSATHSGIDLVAVTGTPVSAAQAGHVVFAGRSNRGTGQTVILAHRNFYTLYAHLNEVKVTCNAVVTTETVIGNVGATGNASGPHLHFAIIDSQGVPIDPMTLVDFTLSPGDIMDTLPPADVNAQVEIVEVISPGDLLSEAVVLRNTGKNINLTGWTITNLAGDVYTFPERNLFNNGELTLFTRRGQDSPVTLYMGRDRALWGEVAILKDADGVVQVVYRISGEPGSP